MALTPGARLGPYEIVAPLGAGGMGEVYKARDTRLDRAVAVKVLPSALAADTQFRERFEREARAVAQLAHPHICTLYDVGEHDGTAFLVMELLDGETLADRLTKGALPLGQALKVAIQIADALDTAHRHGIVHRDLKPGNVMLTKVGAKLLDFGLAKAGPPAVAGVALSMLPTRPANLTAQGTILGTIQYMAPEQLEGSEADVRTDVFAFGAVVYETLTGTKAFEGKSQASVIAAIMHATPAPIARVQPLAPAALDRLVGTCLAKDPGQRWQCVGDLRRELQWLAEDGSQPASPLATARTRTREYVAWGLAALLIIAIVALYPRAPREADALVRFVVSPPIGAVRPAGARFALAPDGENLALVANGADGVRRIFVRRLDASEAEVLPDTDGARGPFWSPDSKSLGFAKNDGIYRVDLDGGVPRRLCDLPGLGPGAIFLGGTWNSRGVIVFATQSRGLFRVPDTGGMPLEVTTLEAGANEVAHAGPWFLPDGQHLLFLALAAGQTRGIVWATSIDEPSRTRIVESDGAAAYVAGLLLSTAGSPRRVLAQPFDPERLMLRGTPQPVREELVGATTLGEPGFAASPRGVLVAARLPSIAHQLEWVHRTGQTLGTAGPIATIATFALAPDERRVVAEVFDSDRRKSDLWLFDSGQEAGTRLTYDGGASDAIWAPDGRRVHFSHGSALRTLAIGQAAQADFENPGSFRSLSDLTHDGRYFVFQAARPRAAIWIQRVGSPGERRALVQDEFGASYARVSPDSRWLAYTLDLPSGPEIFVQPFDRPGDRIRVSLKGGAGPVWRDDSRELYYEGPEGVMAVAVSERDGVLQAGTPQKLFTRRTRATLGGVTRNVEVAAHGQRFLVNTIVGDSDNVPLEVTLNWTTGLKR